jgi:GntR family transcriptional repressor for pyruvate dehydrogenase complex
LSTAAPAPAGPTAASHGAARPPAAGAAAGAAVTRRRAGSDEPRATFPVLQKTSVGLQAAEAIKALIVSGKIKPGEALPSERDLAAMLGISRPSLREAIRALSAINVLDSRQGDGTFVTSLDPSLLAQPINFLLQVDEGSIAHLFEVRRVLEVGAARLAAPRITDEQVALLERLADAGRRAINRPSRYLQFDFEIHTAIIEATGNPLYVSLYQSVSQLSLESRRRTARDADTRARAHDDHIAIIAALRARDADEAARVMQEHLTVVERSFHNRSLAGTAGSSR